MKKIASFRLLTSGDKIIICEGKTTRIPRTIDANFCFGSRDCEMTGKIEREGTLNNRIESEIVRKIVNGNQMAGKVTIFLLDILSSSVDSSFDRRTLSTTDLDCKHSLRIYFATTTLALFSCNIPVSDD